MENNNSTNQVTVLTKQVATLTRQVEDAKLPITVVKNLLEKGQTERTQKFVIQSSAHMFLTY